MNQKIKDIDDGQPAIGAKVEELGFLKRDEFYHLLGHEFKHDLDGEYYAIIIVKGKSGKKYRIEANIKNIDELED